MNRVSIQILNIAMMKKILLYATLIITSLSCFTTMANAQGNPSNPYDDAGAKHNVVLANFFNYYSKQRVANEQMSQKALCEYVCAQIALPDCNLLQQVIASDLGKATQQMGLAETGAYLQAKGLVSSSFAAYTAKLDRSISQQVGAGYTALYRAIVAIETSIQADAALKASERTALLLAASVARHSGKFWTDLRNEATSYTGLSHIHATDETVGDVVKADAAGAVVGAVAGVATGPGVVITSVGGAAISSTVKAVRDFWGWVFG
jgi:hypothetical protein